jgi:hypothetical protein
VDIRKINKISEAFSYWVSLVDSNPEDFELAYKILAISVNDNFSKWSQENSTFDRITELAAYLETNPASKESWEEIKGLIKNTPLK